MSAKTPPSKPTIAGKAFDWNVLRQVLKYVRPYRWQTTLAAGLSVFLGILSTARPILVRDGVDYAVVSADWQALYHAMMWLAGALVLEALGQFAFIYATNDLGQRVIKDIRIKLFGKLLHFKTINYTELVAHQPPLQRMRGALAAPCLQLRTMARGAISSAVRCVEKSTRSCRGEG